MKSVNPSKAVVRGAFILAIAAILTKVLSALYRVPFQNIVGDVGFYIYQQVYPFYGMAMVLSTTGFPVVISKLYAEQKESGDEGKARLLLFVSFTYLQVLGFLSFLLLYFGAERLALWMNDPHLTTLIRVVSVVFLTIPIVSVLRGYYQGFGIMAPTALSQIGEQTIRVLTILVLSYLFMQKGFSLYFVGGGAMVGSITGSIAAFLILFMFVWNRKEWKVIAPMRGIRGKYFPEVKKIIKALTVQGFCICLSGMLLIFIQLADSLNLYSSLIANGIENDMAKSLKGIFDRGQPLIQLGTVAATSMSLTLVPLISRERLAAKRQFLYHKIQMALKVSVVVGVGASVGLWAIIRPTNTMLFENDLGSAVLGALSFVILFTSVILTASAILQGLGKSLFPAAAISAVFPLKYILNLVFIPMYATMGAAISSLLSLTFVSVLLLFRLKKTIKIPLFTMRFWRQVLLAALIMGLSLKGGLYIADALMGSPELKRLSAAVQSLSSVIFGAIMFSWMIIRQRVFRGEELALIPFGSKLVHFIARKERSRDGKED